MKFKFKVVFALLLGTALIYSACKKSGTSPSNETVTPKAMASQVALNLATTLNGGSFGGFDASSGLNAPQKLVINRYKGRKISDLGDVLCGSSFDTTFAATPINDNGVSGSVSGSLSYKFTCTGGNLSGFTTVDNLVIAETTAQLTGTFKIAENLTVTSLNPTNENSNFTIKGTLGYSGAYTMLTGSKGSGSSTFNYTLTSLVYNSDGDLVSGAASFDTKGTGVQGTWSYQGTITFLGNGKATVTINGTGYNVDLTTGTVS